MQKAVKHETASLVTNLSDEVLIPSNDTDGGPANRNLAELREKIKSSRLESLMARQLESELSIGHIEVVDADRPDTAKLDHSSVESENASKPTFSTSNVDHERLLTICAELVEKISASTQIFTELGTNSEALVKFLNSQNATYGSLDGAHSRILDLETIVEQQRLKLSELQELTKAQRNRINVLEVAGTSKNADLLSGDLVFLKDALEDKQSEIDKCHARIEEADSRLKTVLERNTELEEKFEQSSDLLRHANKVLRQKIDTLSQETATREKIEALHKVDLETLAAVQEDYDQLNRRSLEQQARHHAKVEKLEDQIHLLQHQIKSLRLAG